MNKSKNDFSESYASLWSPISGGITAPRGFLATGVHAKLKESGKLDLALLVGPEGTICSGKFTQSVFRADCIDLCKQRIKNNKGLIRAVLINSGQANAFTDLVGKQDNLKVTKGISHRLGLNENEVLICSTGVIGVRMNVQNMVDSFEQLIKSLNKSGGNNAAQAIMTTDLIEKEIAFEANLGNRKVRIGGMAKGSGMIHPNMSTMLGYLTCDASLPKEIWDSVISDSIEESFNAITVDGDTSTNDAFLGFCSGEPIANEYKEDLILGINKVTKYLAKEIAKDGEGSSCLIEVTVKGTANNKEARHIGRTVCGSPLVKTAIHGSDPNWGRIISALGHANILIDIKELNLSIGEFEIIKSGKTIEFDRNNCKKYIMKKQSTFSRSKGTVEISIKVGSGSGQATTWGCDLSKDYVTINADYTT